MTARARFEEALRLDANDQIGRYNRICDKIEEIGDHEGVAPATIKKFLDAVHEGFVK